MLLVELNNKNKMKKEQSVYNKLHKFSAKEEPMKVELAMEDYLSQVEREFDKGERFAKELEKFVSNIQQEVRTLRNNVAESMASIEEIKNKAESEMNEISKQAKKLGLDSSDAYKTWQKVSSLSSQSIKKLDRYWSRSKL